MAPNSVRVRLKHWLTAGAATPARESSTIARLGRRLIGGGKRLIAIFLYLYLMFGLFNLHNYVILQQHHIAFENFGWAFVNALVMAKVMLVAEELHLGARLERLPLIYPVLGKSLIFAAILVAFHVGEDIVAGLWRGQAFAESVPAIGGGGLVGIIVVGVIVTVALIPFFALHEITTVIGSRQLYDLLFRRDRGDLIVEFKSRSTVDARNVVGTR